MIVCEKMTHKVSYVVRIQNKLSGIIRVFNSCILTHPLAQTIRNL